ncbi:hypothetical protein [Streptomyces sp. NPDC040750]|uniref:hypothetical protein n=1 Tax=Streptomyces sp. NPDC040750 TaxID=3154491 RepID=UPI0033C93A81
MQFPVWMDPVTNGGTPMTRALGYAGSLVANWVEAHPSGFPPIVLNLTDGESTDGDPTSAAIALASHATADGAVLLFNLHVSGTGGTPVTFPDSDEGLPDTYARLLFQMSNVPALTRIRAEIATLRAQYDGEIKQAESKAQQDRDVLHKQITDERQRLTADRQQRAMETQRKRADLLQRQKRLSRAESERARVTGELGTTRTETRRNLGVRKSFLLTGH